MFKSGRAGGEENKRLLKRKALDVLGQMGEKCSAPRWKESLLVCQFGRRDTGVTRPHLLQINHITPGAITLGGNFRLKDGRPDQYTLFLLVTAESVLFPHWRKAR